MLLPTGGTGGRGGGHCTMVLTRRLLAFRLLPVSVMSTMPPTPGRLALTSVAPQEYSTCTMTRINGWVGLGIDLGGPPRALHLHGANDDGWVGLGMLVELVWWLGWVG